MPYLICAETDTPVGFGLFSNKLINTSFHPIITNNMVETKRLILSSIDNNHVILDIGLTHTKCGFAKDATPMHIVPTPLRLV